MTSAKDPSATPAAPPLPQMLIHYLHQQAAAQAMGLAPVDPAGEVVPFDAAPVQPVDSRLAWEEALLALRLFGPTTDPPSWRAPPDWSLLVTSHEPAMALALCAGNFPQLVRNLRPLLRATNLSALRPDEPRPLPVPALVNWATQAARQNQYPQTLLAVGCLRLARQFDPAGQWLESHKTDVPAAWRAAYENEQAALAWHRGQAEEASRLWQAQRSSVPVLFNRGMAALFLGRPVEARPWLNQAVAQLPEEGAWHHLGRLYLALAET